jgi:para-aminobenzoate synthetase/4-amino-4-deoxychorismate lyase
MQPRVYLHDNRRQVWRDFRDPIEVFSVDNIEDVVPTLEKIEARVEQDGLWAAGFIAYEAGPAFDAALTAHSDLELPLLWFGLFESHEVIELPRPTELRGSTVSDWQPSQTLPEYTESIRIIKDQIARGNTYQVNYTMRLDGRFEGDPWNYFLKLAQDRQSGYGAYVQAGKHAICSASPELFFDRQGTELCSKPMKGTATRGLTQAQDQAQIDWLYHSEKDRAENLMIVDMIRNDMGRVAEIGSVEVPHLFEVEKYPTILQMTSTVHARTERSTTEVLQALFPCASITGAPKVRTMQIIKDLEPEPRGIYTGSIGFLAPGRRAQFNVAIRTVAIDTVANRAEYGVGSGIVWDSSADGEYAECRTKSRVLDLRRPRVELFDSLLWTKADGYYLLERHLNRLADSADYFNFSFDKVRAGQLLREFAESKLADGDHKVRLVLACDGQMQPEALPIDGGPYPHPHRGQTLPAAPAILASQPIDPTHPFFYHKTTARAIYDDAVAQAPPGHDVLFWNPAGELTEFSAANLVLEIDSHYWTPPISSGLLGGTLRAELLANDVLQERTLTRADLAGADRIWRINSVRGWREISIQDAV